MSKLDTRRLDEGSVHDIFQTVAACYPERPFIAVGPLASRSYLPDGISYSYTETARIVAALRAAYADAGYGPGHRIGLLLDNRPEHHFHFLALNSLGISAVPINPDYRADEARYLIEHSELVLVVTLPHRLAAAQAAIALCDTPKPVVLAETVAQEPLPQAPSPAMPATPSADTEVCLFYTSGTTGRPKGCVVTNQYYAGVGKLYRECGGLVTFREGEERIFNPLPLFHINAGVFTFMGALTTGGCAILPDRFHPQSWWQELADSEATIFHYLGVIPGMLMKLADSPHDRGHRIRFAVGAGVEPEIHAAFEQRFGLPLVELWGMTETGGGFIAADEPRMIDTRAMGRPRGRAGLDLDARVVDGSGNDVPVGQQGELLVRRTGGNPRQGFFTAYLKNPQATDQAWAGGWFHTGDVVRQDESGMLFFVDRNKNIIRRSGENIAAAEVEATLLAHPKVAEVAVLAAPDEVREEEVFACIVPRNPADAGEALARELFAWANERLAYYKPPGWVLFVQGLPKTSTQKVQKSEMFGKDKDPRASPGVVDLRQLKRR